MEIILALYFIGVAIAVYLFRKASTIENLLFFAAFSWMSVFYYFNYKRKHGK